jgi:hypothetical protein
VTAIARPIPAASDRPRWQTKLPWLALAPLALIPVLGTNSFALNALLVATEFLLMAAGVRRPVWVVAALLVNEITASNLVYHLGGLDISNRLVLTLISVPIVAPHVTAGLDVGRKAGLTIALAFAFVFMTTFADSLYASEAYTLQFLRYIAIGVYLLLLIPVSVRDRDDLRDLCVVLVGVGAVAALAGVFQHYSQAHGAPVWTVLPEAGPGTDTFAAWQDRAIGLSENPILASNSVMIIGLFALGPLLLAPMSANVRRLLAAGLLLMAAAAYFTYTRSWAIAMIPAILSIAVVYKGAYKREFWLIILVLAGGLWYWSDLNSTRYTVTSASQDDSIAARPVLWSLSFDIAADHPWLGVGHDAFLTLSPQYAKTLDQSILNRQNARDVVGVYTPHDDILNIWLSWGFITLAIYVALSVVIGVNYYQTFVRAADPLVRGLAIGGLSALIGFQVNSLFHNFLDSTLTLWILGGFSLLLLKLSQQALSGQSRRKSRVKR